MIHGTDGDTVHDGSLVTWKPLTWVHENRNKRNEFGEQRRECHFNLFIMYSHQVIVCCSVETTQKSNRFPHVSNEFGAVESTSRSHSVQ